MQNLKVAVENLIKFLRVDIWKIPIDDLSGTKSFFIKQLRVVLLASRGFDEDKCLLRASALTFYSLLSIVPVAALAFGIAKGFGFEKLLEKEILKQFVGQEEVIIQVINYARALLENTQGGVIAGVGIAALFWTVIKVLGNIEASFNDIWGVKEPRTVARKLSDYLSVMLLCPILIIMSSSITVFVSTQIVLITEKIALLGILSPIIYFALKLLPYCVIWILFTFIYMFMPNIKVSFKSALLAGVVAGTIYEIVQLLYINFQVGVAKYNAIYGSFAALPLFLIWLQLSWLIVLYGAEISFAHQNVDTYEHEPDSLQISVHFKKLLSLEIAHLIILNFSKGAEPLTASQVSHTLEIPIRLVRQIIYELVESRVISETKTEELKESAYQPAKDINGLSIQYIIEELEKSGADNIPVMHTKELEILSETLQDFGNTIKNSPSNKLLKDL